MIIDNIDKIKELMKFESEYDYYFVQVIQRRKDNLGMQCDARGIKSYYINGMKDFELKLPEIKLMSKSFNARVYIHLNPRNYRSTILKTISSLVDRLGNNETLIGTNEIFNRVSSKVAKSGIRNSKLWVVDIDNPKVDIDKVIGIIDNICTPEGKKFVTKIPTISGTHLITRPFNTSEFRKYYPNKDEIEIPKTENPTILYYESNERNYKYHELITKYGGMKVSVEMEIEDKGTWRLIGMSVPKPDNLRDLYTRSWKDAKIPKNYVPLGGMDDRSFLCINTNDNEFYICTQTSIFKIKSILNINRYENI